MHRSGLRKNLLILAFALLATPLFPLDAAAATVFVMSVGNGQAQVIIDNRTVRVLRVGEVSPEGVKLVEIRGNAALLASAALNAAASETKPGEAMLGTILSRPARVTRLIDRDGPSDSVAAPTSGRLSTKVSMSSWVTIRPRSPASPRGWSQPTRT